MQPLFIDVLACVAGLQRRDVTLNHAARWPPLFVLVVVSSLL